MAASASSAAVTATASSRPGFIGTSSLSSTASAVSSYSATSLGLPTGFSSSSSSSFRVSAPPPTAHFSFYQLIDETRFSHIFRSCKDIDQGKYQIVSPEIPIYTRGLYSCLGIIAKSFNKDGSIRKIGLAHYDTIGPNLKEFFGKISENNTVRTSIYIIGGDHNPMENDGLMRIKDALRGFPVCAIAGELIDPFEINDEINKLPTDILSLHERRWDYSLSVGITNNGRDIFLVQHCTIAPLSAERFPFFWQGLRKLELDPNLPFPLRKRILQERRRMFQDKGADYLERMKGIARPHMQAIAEAHGKIAEKEEAFEQIIFDSFVNSFDKVIQPDTPKDRSDYEKLNRLNLKEEHFTLLPEASTEDPGEHTLTMIIKTQYGRYLIKKGLPAITKNLLNVGDRLNRFDAHSESGITEIIYQEI